jgi:membrane fusion protein, heavy metal efflux system
MKPYRLLVLALACFTFTAMAEEGHGDDPLLLDATAVKSAGIVVAKATMRVFDEEMKAPGEVKANAYDTVLVSPRIPSQVVARKARLGDVVKAGQPLVELSSVDVAETQGALIVAEQEWQRVSSLGKEAVSARRYNEVRVARDQARAKLRAYGVSDGQIATMLRAGSAHADGSFYLAAPDAGRIASDDFMIGAWVEPGTTLFTLVKEGSVWVEAKLAPADAERAKPGARARVLAHGQAIEGTVVQRSHRTDERTRTESVRLMVGNAGDLLHDGELVDARIVVAGGKPRLAVPDDAIVLMQNQATVFVDLGQGRFEPRSVRTGESRGGWTEIGQGLSAGETYVEKGTFVLKARMLKSQLGEH